MGPNRPLMTTLTVLVVLVVLLVVDLVSGTSLVIDLLVSALIVVAAIGSYVTYRRDQG